jgi:hypothetical protein
MRSKSDGGPKVGQSAIQAILEALFPYWEAPEDNGKTWTACLCPYHLEARPSAAISYELDAISCQACEFGGDLVGVVWFMLNKEAGEEVPFVNAIRKAEEILVDSGADLPESFARLLGTKATKRKGTHAGLRSRTPPGGW